MWISLLTQGRQLSELDELSRFLTALMGIMEAHITQNAPSQPLMDLMDGILFSVIQSQNGSGQ